MEFVDWRTVFITIAAVFVLWTGFQIVRYTLIKKKAEEELKKIDARIAALNKELEETKKTLEDQIKRLSK